MALWLRMPQGVVTGSMEGQPRVAEICFWFYYKVRRGMLLHWKQRCGPDPRIQLSQWQERCLDNVCFLQQAWKLMASLAQGSCSRRGA